MVGTSNKSVPGMANLSIKTSIHRGFPLRELRPGPPWTFPAQERRAGAGAEGRAESGERRACGGEASRDWEMDGDEGISEFLVARVPAMIVVDSFSMCYLITIIMNSDSLLSHIFLPIFPRFSYTLLIFPIFSRISALFSHGFPLRPGRNFSSHAADCGGEMVAAPGADGADAECPHQANEFQR